jgi:hypothetical protein
MVLNSVVCPYTDGKGYASEDGMTFQNSATSTAVLVTERLRGRLVKGVKEA